MKFPRNTRSLRNPFDVAPFAAVFFLLVIFLMLATLLPAPGIPLQLPGAENLLPGTDRPTVSVALDADGRFYFASQIVSETQLKSNLAAAVKNSREPLTLVIQADQSVTYGQLVRLTLLARAAGIQNALLATLPRIVNAPDCCCHEPRRRQIRRRWNPARTARRSWSGSRWFAVLLLTFAAHVGFIMTFGEKKPAIRRPVMDVPRLRLASAVPMNCSRWTIRPCLPCRNNTISWSPEPEHTGSEIGAVPLDRTAALAAVVRKRPGRGVWRVSANQFFCGSSA